MNSIIHGDCVERMAMLPDGCVNLVVTSPPYRAEKEYEHWPTLDDYKSFAKRWVEQVPRLLTPNGSFWLNLGYTKLGENETLPLTYLYHPLVDLKLVQELVWHYEGGMSYKKRFTHRTERWMWFAKDPNNVVFNLDAVRDLALNRTQDKRNNPLGKNPTDYWYFDRVVSGNGKVSEKTIHPCQFPEKMLERIILACSNAGDVVLDPFSGSGTTCAVAKRLGRKYVGIEQNFAYFIASLKRVSQ